MATAPKSAPLIPHAARITSWLPSFLRDELAPYPGRAATVARITVACALTAIIVVVFRIPGGAIAMMLALILAREDILSDARSTVMRIGTFALVGIFVPIGGRFFAGIALTHFLWEAASIFLCFFLLRTLTNFALASSFSLVVTNILAIWYLPGPAGRNVEITLWQVLAASTGAVVALTVEVVFHAVSRHDEVLSGVSERLRLIQELAQAYAAGDKLPITVTRELSRYAVVGVGGLRRHIARSSNGSIYRMRMSTLVSLTGRAVDFAAALPGTTGTLAEDDRVRAGKLAAHLAEIRTCLMEGTQQAAEWEPGQGAGHTPLLNELEAMAALIPSVLASETSLDPRLELLDTQQENSRLFVRDAFVNPEHLRFALSGTLAAMLCYVLYMGLNWPALSTSVTTCVLTGLSNIGASRQKQVLRVAGAALGGFVFGMGSQIFILPSLDTIGGFVLLIAVVSAIAAWITTSSSRLSYAGLQVALAFYLIVMSEPTIQLSLSVARDRVLGVLLGIFMMWLVFERLYTRPAANEMVSFFIRNTRLIADLVETTIIDADAPAILLLRRQREQIYRNFGEVNAQSDAVPFETGAQRAAHMAARDRIRRWQAAERTFYLLQAPLLQFRIFADSSDRTHTFYGIETSFRVACGKAFRQIAASLEAQLQGTGATQYIDCSLSRMLDELEAGHAGEFTEREQALMRMTRTIGGIVDRMSHEVTAEPLFADV